MRYGAATLGGVNQRRLNTTLTHDGTTGRIMAEALKGSLRARLAVLYLLAVTAAAFVVPAFEATRAARWYVVPSLLLLQVFTLLACRVGKTEIFRAAWRLKWLFVFLLACY